VPLALAVHGGAWNIPDALVEPSREGVARAARLGWEALTGGADALDAVELVVRALEDDPGFDAGVGSRLNAAGQVELDASLMDGRDLRVGAIAAVGGLRHPVSVARTVMERSPHVLLAGPAARRFAREHGAELCRTRDLLVGRELDRYLRVRRGERILVEREFHEGPLGTVGAVAMDRRGHLAAATSTGGTQDKMPGRVGDTPIPAAGTWADDRKGAASCTGWGESILRCALAKTAVDLAGAGRPASAAGRGALRELGRIGGHGGLILIDRRGRVASAFNTPRMARAVATERGGLRVAVNRGAAGR
jgi:beta-aspartyl-peptidase (threonine type)